MVSGLPGISVEVSLVLCTADSSFLSLVVPVVWVCGESDHPTDLAGNNFFSSFSGVTFPC